MEDAADKDDREEDKGDEDDREEDEDDREEDKKGDSRSESKCAVDKKETFSLEEIFVPRLRATRLNNISGREELDVD